MISFVTFKWKPREGYRSKFDASHVNTLASMVKRHYRKPHRFICVTDDPAGVRVDTTPLWTDHSELCNPTWPDGPSCFRRLRVFDTSFSAIVQTPRFVCLDLDMVITSDITDMFERPEPFAIFRTHLPHIPVCGSLFMVETGRFPEIWHDFNRSPMAAIGAMKARGFRGSDQAWLTYRFGPEAPGWSNKDGVYSYMELKPRGRVRGQGAFPNRKLIPDGSLPDNARIVVFTGKPDPWDREARSFSPWIDEHYH